MRSEAWFTSEAMAGEPGLGRRGVSGALYFLHLFCFG
jgi:hypothetical protein